jgi:hypothetical protein
VQEVSKELRIHNFVCKFGKRLGPIFFINNEITIINQKYDSEVHFFTEMINSPLRNASLSLPLIMEDPNLSLTKVDLNYLFFFEKDNVFLKIIIIKLKDYYKN